MSRVLYEWNRLDAAEQNALRCKELARQWGNIEFEAAGYVMLAWVEQARCRPESAQEATRAAERLLGGCSLSTKQSTWLVPALERLWMAQGDVDRALDHLRKRGVTLDGVAADAAIPYRRSHDYVILLRALLAQADHDAALALSERLLAQAEATSRTGGAIEILVLQALAHQGKRDTERALPALERAFDLAQPDGFVRVFLDEGEPMARLLYQARTHHIGTAFAFELLSGMSSPSPTAPVPRPSMPLIDALSARELEVLRLIEAGHSNQEIADMLVISIKTAKRHISNIYDRLGAKSRTQALSLGRELGLFE